MGQKVNPISLRLGHNRTWDSRWYVKPIKYADTFLEDIKIKQTLQKMPEVASSDVSSIEIFRNPQRIRVVLHTSKVGFLVGKNGANIEKLSAVVSSIAKIKTLVRVEEIDKPSTNATLIANNIARQLVNRGSYKRILKKAVADAIRDGVAGIKIKVSGRLNGVEIARSDGIKEGRVPLHTLRSIIDYGFAVANTSYGSIGVKVWVYLGEANASQRKNRSDAGEIIKKRKEGSNDA